MKEKYPNLLDLLARKMSRVQALEQINALLEIHPCDGTALQLIELFNIQCEELAESGVPYEILRALEKHSMVLKRFC